MVNKKIQFLLLLLILLSVSSTLHAKEAQQDNDIEEARIVIEKICFSLKPYLERPDKFNNVYVQNDPSINAFADSNNNITFFIGMIDFVRDENEIAAVCGHELAHLSAQHIKRSTFTRIVAGVAQEAVGGILGNVAGSALYTKQSRKHEREADSRGLTYMWYAGYDPRAVWKFWQNLETKYSSGDSKMEKYFSTHPVTKERIENLKVLLVRNCKEAPTLPYCDEILQDQDLLQTFNNFENR